MTRIRLRQLEAAHALLDEGAAVWDYQALKTKLSDRFYFLGLEITNSYVLQDENGWTPLMVAMSHEPLAIKMLEMKDKLGRFLITDQHINLTHKEIELH